MRRGFWGLIVLPLTVSLALAEAPTRSLRPEPRPYAPEVAGDTVAPTARPQMRPAHLGEEEPAATAQPAAPVQPAASRKGSVCKNRNIKGTAIKPITSRTRGCGIKAPVLVTAIDGVRLNPPATINCTTAGALASWIDQGLQPAFGNQVVQLNIVDSYSCRPRNNVRGNRISEHGLGNAIDIAGFVLNTGKVMTVRSNYGSQIKRAQRAACGTFHTTLGPGSDGHHEDHLHLDVSQRGGNPYCH